MALNIDGCAGVGGVAIGNAAGGGITGLVWLNASKSSNRFISEALLLEDNGFGIEGFLGVMSGSSCSSGDGVMVSNRSIKKAICCGDTMARMCVTQQSICFTERNDTPSIDGLNFILIQFFLSNVVNSKAS